MPIQVSLELELLVLRFAPGTGSPQLPQALSPSLSEEPHLEQYAIQVFLLFVVCIFL
jgi:hypothetical protein